MVSLPEFLSSSSLHEIGAGDIMLARDLDRADMCFVAEGVARALIPPPAKRPKTVLLSGPGSWLGFDAYNHGQNILEYRAVTPCRIVLTCADDVREKTTREELESFLRQVCHALGGMVSWHYMGIPLRQRLIMLLMDLIRMTDATTIPVAQAEIAGLLNVHRATLNRELDWLEKTGVVSFAYREIVLGSLDELGQILRQASGGSGN